MRRILVPLDGTEMAASILSDAQRLAGRDGELILVRNAHVSVYDVELEERGGATVLEEVQQYLDQQADRVREAGTRVQARPLVIGDNALAIDEAARIFHADMIACATHGRGPLARLVRGGVAWRALAHSEVPVLLRHWFRNDDIADATSKRRRIMVPLDGSRLAETALPLATELAREWDASLYLVRVTLFPFYDTLSLEAMDLVDEAKRYVQSVARVTPGHVHTDVLSGSTVEVLTQAAEDHGITDVVMASHGRTGLARVILGSVADELLHRMHCPIIVIPALAARATAEGARQKVQATG